MESDLTRLSERLIEFMLTFPVHLTVILPELREHEASKESIRKVELRLKEKFNQFIHHYQDSLSLTAYSPKIIFTVFMSPIFFYVSDIDSEADSFDSPSLMKLFLNGLRTQTIRS